MCTSLIIITGLLTINISPNQLIQAQGNNNFSSNNDLSKSIEQGVTSQLNNAFSNTPLGSGNSATQTSNNNNNIATQTSNNNNNIATQTSNNNNNPNIQQNNPIGNNFLISGPLSSFLSTPTGNWVVNGSWILKVQNGNLSFFSGDMQWDPTNLTKLQHTHNFANFRALPDTQSISLGPDRVIDIKGMMDIGANNKIEWVNVPAEIKTAGNTITVLILDDAKTGNHFNNYPIFGKISHIEKCSDNGAYMDFDPSIVKCSS
jgi:hypothetical protein